MLVSMIKISPDTLVFGPTLQPETTKWKGTSSGRIFQHSLRETNHQCALLILIYMLNVDIDTMLLLGEGNRLNSNLCMTSIGSLSLINGPTCPKLAGASRELGSTQRTRPGR